MGASVGNGGPRGRAGRRYRPMSEINVTPFVDVMLVLLVIFMITAPLLTVGVPVDLPETRAQAMREDKEPLAVSITADGRIFLEDTEVTLEELAPRLTAIAETGFDERVFVRADQTVPSGRLLEVMGELNGAGFRKVGLITAPASRRPDGAGGR